MKKNNFKVKTLYLILVILTLLLIQIAIATPNSINIQGKLTDSSGSLQTGTFNFTFGIYDSFTSGNKLYETNITATTDSRGVYDIILNNVNLNFEKQLYLGVEVNADGEMEPRVNLTSVPYTFRANTSEELDKNKSYTAASLNLTDNLTIGDKIIFGLGGFIDNLVNGFLRITGNLNITGGLITGGGLNISGDLSVNEQINLTASGNIDSSGTISADTLKATTQVDVGGGFSAGGLTIQQDGNIVTQGDILFSGNVTIINVSHLSVNGSFLPSLDATFDLGNGSLRWRNANFSGIVAAGTIDGINVKVGGKDVQVEADAWNFAENATLVLDNETIIRVGNITNIMIGNTSWAITAVNDSINDYYNHSVDLSGYQLDITGNCNGQVVVSVNDDGTLNCEADDTGAASGIGMFVVSGDNKHIVLNESISSGITTINMSDYFINGTSIWDILDNATINRSINLSLYNQSLDIGSQAISGDVTGTIGATVISDTALDDQYTRLTTQFTLLNLTNYFGDSGFNDSVLRVGNISNILESTWNWADNESKENASITSYIDLLNKTQQDWIEANYATGAHTALTLFTYSNITLFFGVENVSMIKLGNTSWAITAVNDSIKDYYNHSIDLSGYSQGAHYTDSDIDGTETAFNNWDKSELDEFTLLNLTNYFGDSGFNASVIRVSNITSHSLGDYNYSVMLDDYYDTEAELTGVLDDNYLAIGTLYSNFQYSNITEFFGVENVSMIKLGNTSWAITAVNDSIKDYYNHSIDLSSYNQSLDIGAQAVGGEVSGTIGNVVLDDDALDDQYLKIEDNISLSLWNVSGSNIFLREITGNVGIGTTSPQYLLQVANVTKAVNLSGILYVDGDTGNVGIGTASPAALLDVGANTRIGINTIAFAGSSTITSGGLLDISAGGTRDFRLIVSSGGNILLSGGNVGIGTASPSSTLTVSGNITTSKTNNTFNNFVMGEYNSSCAGFRFGSTGGWILSCA